jgi:hypothetical protein
MKFGKPHSHEVQRRLLDLDCAPRLTTKMTKPDQVFVQRIRHREWNYEQAHCSGRETNSGQTPVLSRRPTHQLAANDVGQTGEVLGRCLRYLRYIGGIFTNSLVCYRVLQASYNLEVPY